MKKLTLFFCSFAIAAAVQASIIHIPADYPTIQEGINVSNIGDTVLVEPGTYLENINFIGKGITVASLYLVTQDEAYISQTIIDGHNAGTVVYFTQGEDSTAVLCGFTLINGFSYDSGGGIRCYYTSPELQYLVIKNNSAQYYGGGIYCYNYSSPRIRHVSIVNNTAIYGGGLLLDWQSNPLLQDVTISGNSAVNYGGGIYFYHSSAVFDGSDRCNIFLNSAPTGSDLYSEYGYEVIEVVVDTFTVLNPTTNHAFPLQEFSFDILNGKIEQAEADLYVSPGGDDANSGLTPDDPLKTIYYACQVIYADSLNPRIIHLLEGTYSTSATGETFPVRVPEYVSLEGISKNEVILDAEGLSRVMDLSWREHIEISGMTITGGYAATGDGGGIYCYYSTPVLKDLRITGNSSANAGGGIYLYISDPYLENVTITYNMAASNGGGINFEDSHPVFDTLNRCNIYMNEASLGNDLFAGWLTGVNVIVDTFTVMVPKAYHAYPPQYFTFDILHGYLPQENIDLFFSPGGDDGNTGLTADDPLKTIQHGLSLINENRQDFYTLHLLNGIYSSSSNGESFPLVIPDLVQIKGESESGVILDAEGQARGITIDNCPGIEISDLTIRGGNSYYAGGIYCYNASPLLRNLNIKENNSDWAGGGIYLESSFPVLKNVTIKNNTAYYYGGGMYLNQSYPVFDSIDRCSIYFNEAETGKDLAFPYYYEPGAVEVFLDTFTVMIPRSAHAYALLNFSFDILHGMLPQENIEFFVSPNGDDANSGLSVEDPFKTIGHALSISREDDLNFYDISLLNGTYSTSSNGETFPLEIGEYITLKGESTESVILDAEGDNWEGAAVIFIVNSANTEISDMTITGGRAYNWWYYAGGIHCENSDPLLTNLTITGNSGYTGGGIGFNNCDPVLQNITVSDNTSYYGGGINFENSRAEMAGVTITGNTASSLGGGIYFSNNSTVLFDNLNRCNIFLNSAPGGNDLCAYNSPDVLEIVVDTFTVMQPTAYHAFPLEAFDFDILNAKIEQVEADLYVSPGGDNENSGLTEQEPLKNIYIAYAKMLADSLHPHTIHLLPGTYSASATDERFPLNCIDYVNLAGESETGTILDAEGTAGVISMNSVSSMEISNLTITGGYTSSQGGGISCNSSSPALRNLSILNCHGNYGGGIGFSGTGFAFVQDINLSGNSALYYGGGIYCSTSHPVLQDVVIRNNSAGNGGGIYISDNSGPLLQSVRITNNHAEYSGGGLGCGDYAGPELQDVTVSNNSAGSSGGGIYFYYNSAPVFDSIDRCNIYFNSAPAGNDLYAAEDWYGSGFFEVIVDTFTVLYPNSYHAWKPENFSFDILHGKIEQADADLYVSTSGDNDNSGLTTDEPLKNIRFAFMKILADSLDPKTVHVAEGTYSPSANGEVFPLNIPDHVSLAGASQEGVILDADLQSAVIFMNNAKNVKISGLTVSRGGPGISIISSNPELKDITVTNNNEVGIYLSHANPLIQNVTISYNNSSSFQGGGISCYYSSPVLQDVNVMYNHSAKGGGIYCEQESYPNLHQVRISNNSALAEGGGIYNSNSAMAMEDVTISYNTAQTGGGIYNDGYYYYAPGIVFDTTERCNIYLNEALTGADLYSIYNMHVVVDTFTVLQPKYYHASPFDHFTFDILHGKTELVNADMYVSPDGNNANTGLTAADPLKTVLYAVRLIAEDSQHPNTIHLSDGIYSDSTNGEIFPLRVPDYISLKGESEDGVILDAKGLTRVIEFTDNPQSGLSDMTLTGGFSLEDGGGMTVDHSSVSLSRITVENSIARKGGGICFDHSGGVLDGVTVRGDSCEIHGGGIFIYYSSPAIYNASIIDNTAGNSAGGIYCGHSSPVMQNVILSDNSAGINGGGIYLGTSSDVVMDSVEFLRNYAGAKGGGIYSSSSDPVMKNVTVMDNIADDMGGGMALSNSDPVLQNIMVLGNASETGGGLYCSNVGSILVNALITGNTSTDAGGAIYCASSQLRLINSDILNNEAVYGSGISCVNTDLEFINSIIQNESGNDIYFKETNGASAAIFSYSDLPWGESSVITSNNGTVTWGEGNIYEDPMFEPGYNLMAESPCRNAGSPVTDTTGLHLPPYDLAGGPRIWLGRIDMGAFEWNNVGVEELAVGSWQLAVNCYPNPLSSATTFEYELGETGFVTLAIYNNIGQEVEILVNEQQTAGTHQVQWNAESLPAGIYYYRLLTANCKLPTGKLVKY